MGQGKVKQKGFTLMEVMIAMTVFAVFAAMYVSSEGGNLSDSLQMREETLLRSLAELKLNEVVTNPPELRDSLTVSKDTKAFEENPLYQYTVEWKKFELPDLSAIEGREEGDPGPEENSTLNAIVLKNVKTNMEKLLWQVSVKVTNKESGFFYQVATWLYNHKAEVKIEGI